MTQIISLILMLSLAGCSSNAPETPVDQVGDDSPASEAVTAPSPGAPTTPAESAGPVPAQLPEVVAYVNGDPITGTDVETGITELETRAGQPVPANRRDVVVRDVLNQLIGYRLLLQETRARMTSVPEADVDAQVTELRSQFSSEEAFFETLQLREMTLEMLRTAARQSLQVDSLLESEIGTGPAVPATEIEEFYEQNPREFRQDEQVRASHILFSFPENADATSRDELRVRAADALNLVKTGADFAAVAGQYSDDPGSRPNGGDLGYFQRGQMVPPFDQAAFSLATGQTSDLVETSFGYHIIQVTDKQPPRTIPLAEVRQEVQLFLEGRNRDVRMQEFVDSLRAAAQLDIYI